MSYESGEPIRNSAVYEDKRFSNLCSWIIINPVLWVMNMGSLSETVLYMKINVFQTCTVELLLILFYELWIWGAYQKQCCVWR